MNHSNNYFRQHLFSQLISLCNKSILSQVIAKCKANYYYKQTIALLYKYRWKIEVFFKKLKQNFPLQYFVGDNQNAIEIQIWMALIALLLLSVIHQNNKTKMAFSVFATIFKLHLFNYIGIKQLLAQYKKKKPVHPIQTDMFNSS